MDVVSRTTALCADCELSHPASIVVRDGRVYGVVECPQREREWLLSSNAALFLEFRRRSCTPHTAAPPPGLRPMLNYISITTACNLSCAVCGARPEGERREAFLEVHEVLRRAAELRRGGGRILHLFGGEPTLHPALLEIVAGLHRMGLSVGLVSNGSRLATEVTLAPALKRAGLSRVCLQFDSLSERTLTMLRRPRLHDKHQAIANILGAGLRLGLNCTVTDHNLGEMGELLDHHLRLGPGVVNMTFATAAPTGTHTIEPGHDVDRERIVTALLAVGAVHAFGVDDFMPLPAYRPWGIEVHPDCGVHLVLVHTPTGVVPLNRLVDLARAERRLSRVSARWRPGRRTVLPVLHLMAAARPGRRRQLSRVAVALALKRPGFGLVNVGVSDYRAAMFLDEQRLARCASAFHTAAGPVKACLHFFAGPSLPGSRRWEAERGLC